MVRLPCPVCLTDAETYSGSGDWHGVICERCGRFSISDTLAKVWQGQRSHNDGRLQDPAEEALLPFLSAYIRQAAEQPRLLTDNWRSFAEETRRVPVSHRVRRLMELIAARSAGLGVWAPLSDPAVAPTIGVQDKDELRFLLVHLKRSGKLDWGQIAAPPERKRFAVDQGLELGAQLTLDGWESISPTGGGAILGTCFVAMSFDPLLDEIYEHGIKAAVEQDCGFQAYRVDRDEHNDVITDRIIGGIRAAQFMVADFTGQRQGVYFEAGFARGLNRIVIWTCREDDKDNLHFDTRQNNHILWKDALELRRKLTDRIRATIENARMK